MQFGFIRTIKNEVLVKWPLRGKASQAAQNWIGKTGWPSQARRFGKTGYRRTHGAQITFRHVPACFMLIPGSVMLQVADEPIGATDWQAHFACFERTRMAMSSKSRGVHSAREPSTPSTSIFSKVAMSPPNSGGSIRSSFTTWPPSTSSTGEPAWASAKSLSRCDLASDSATAFMFGAYHAGKGNQD